MQIAMCEDKLQWHETPTGPPLPIFKRESSLIYDAVVRRPA